MEGFSPYILKMINRGLDESTLSRAILSCKYKDGIFRIPFCGCENPEISQDILTLIGSGYAMTVVDEGSLVVLRTRG